jgi:nucleolar pre-ribosomal-associated protein 2
MPSSWRLLCYLLLILPRATAARALIDKQFMSILRQTLEEAGKVRVDVVMAEASSIFDSGSKEEQKPKKSTKKRNHDGELVGNSSPGNDLADFIEAILSVVDVMIQSRKSITDEEGKNFAFAAEYMKTLIRTNAKEAAIILGSWLSLCQTAFENEALARKDLKNWLAPFVEIWNSHMTEEHSLMQFSLHCTQSVLSLLRAAKTGRHPKLDWAPELEALISRNIMNPAKIEKWEQPDSDLLSTLTKVSVIQDTANAPRLFEVAIRSIQPHGSRRRRPNDDTWLQTVFKTLKDAMPPQKASRNGKDIGAMLQCAIDHKLGLDLSDLRAITSEYSLPEGREDWGLLAIVIKLDANVFLIPNGEKDLLQTLLDRITKTSIDDTRPEVSDQVVSEVLVPLMGEFAKARDLSGFLKHWLTQLVEFDKLRKDAMRFSMDFGAWEDDALQEQLRKLLEASLTLHQINQILDWLSTEVAEHPDAVCVLLEAIAGSINHEEVVDAIGLRFYHIMFDSGVSDKLDGRTKWRSWRILSQSLGWLMAPNIDELSRLWQQSAKPFKSLSSRAISNVIGNTSKLERLEIRRFICAAWNFAGKNSQMETSCKPFALNVLRQLAQDIRPLPAELRSGEDLGNEACDSAHKTLEPGFGWTTWSSAKLVFVEYSKILQ